MRVIQYKGDEIVLDEIKGVYKSKLRKKYDVVYSSGKPQKVLYLVPKSTPNIKINLKGEVSKLDTLKTTNLF